jgi:hypothetical protein
MKLKAEFYFTGTSTVMSLVSCFVFSEIAYTNLFIFFLVFFEEKGVESPPVLKKDGKYRLTCIHSKISKTLL